MKKIILTITFASIGLAVPGFSQKADRTSPPELGPPPSLKLPPIQHLKLSNGVPVVLMEKRQVPLVQINLIVRGGTANDPVDQPGLASITAAMMEEGAGERNALEFSDAVDYLGASIDVNAGPHTMAVALFTPCSKLDSALALFGDVTLRPRFSAEELERNRMERLTTLLQWHDQPRVIGSALFNEVLYGKAHPYGLPTMGNEKSIRGFTVEALKQFHSRYFTPANATIVVVGDVAPELIIAKLNTVLGAWKGIAPPSPQFPSAPQRATRTLYLVDKPGAAQSVIRIGLIGAQRKTEDYYAITVMNTILGGSFTSRLNNNLREQHGYSYGAGSRFTFLPMPGPFVASADVQTDVTDKALTEFFKELNNIVNISDEELMRAKNYVALGYPSDFQSVRAIAGKLAEFVAYDLSDDYFNNYTKNILAVTKDEVVRVARKYIVPEKMAVVIVGDRKKIEQGIAALNLGEIQNLTIEDVLGKRPEIQTK